MRPVIGWELRQRRAAVLWWTLAAVGLVAMLLLIYPSIHDQAAQLNKVLNQLPSSLKTLKTGGTSVDITTPVGYLHAQLFYITLPLLFIIMAINRGSNLIGKEEQSRTLELLLARPISRGKLLLAKGLSGCLELLIVGGGATAATLVFTKLVNMDIATKPVLVASTYTVAFSLSFGIIAFALTAAGRLTKRASTAVATILAFGGYIIASLSGASHWLITPAKFVPYHYFDPQHLLVGNYSAGLNIYLIGVLVAGTLAAWLGFRNRDID